MAGGAVVIATIGRMGAPVAALYIDPRGPYPQLLGPELCWDEKRDARNYAGPWPVVAHPPCGPWGALKHLYRGNEHDCGPRAVEQVRAFGGVLEHPKRSDLWDHCGLPLPIKRETCGTVTNPCHFWSVQLDEYDGWSVEVDQCAWGHVARKPTWLYFVGVSIRAVTRTIRTGGTPTARSAGNTMKLPPPASVLSAPPRRPARRSRSSVTLRG